MTEAPLLVGLSGYARAGKDTVARIMVEDHGYTAVAFADLLRSCVEVLNPIVGVRNGWAPGADRAFEVLRYQDVLGQFGYEGAKESEFGSEFRAVLQRMGTEVGRKLLGNNIWVEATLNSLPQGPVVVTDCRFPNEAQAVTDKLGQVIRVNRPGYGPANDHPSETSLDDWKFDVIIDNDGTLDDLREKVASNLKYLSLSHWTAA